MDTKTKATGNLGSEKIEENTFKDLFPELDELNSLFIPKINGCDVDILCEPGDVVVNNKVLRDNCKSNQRIKEILFKNMAFQIDIMKHCCLRDRTPSYTYCHKCTCAEAVIEYTKNLLKELNLEDTNEKNI